MGSKTRRRLDTNHPTTIRAALCCLATLALAAPAPAQEAAATAATPQEADLEEVELGRSPAELRYHVDAKPIDRDVLDTAVIFTNAGRAPGRANCVAFDDDGIPVGRFQVKLPGAGLRFVLASDIGNGRDFVGSVSCRTRGDVLGSAVLLGAQVTNLDVVHSHHSGMFQLRFPLVATY